MYCYYLLSHRSSPAGLQAPGRQDHLFCTIGSSWALHHCWLDRSSLTAPCYPSTSLNNPKAELSTSSKQPSCRNSEATAKRMTQWRPEHLYLSDLHMDLVGNEMLNRTAQWWGPAGSKGAHSLLPSPKLWLSHLSEVGSSHKWTSRQRIARLYLI